MQFGLLFVVPMHPTEMARTPASSRSSAAVASPNCAARAVPCSGAFRRSSAAHLRAVPPPGHREDPLLRIGADIFHSLFETPLKILRVLRVCT